MKTGSQTLLTNLLMTSLYLLAFELLKNTVVERIKGFFTFDYVNGDAEVDSQYQEVKDLHRSAFQASLIWLQQNDAITIDDLHLVDAIRRHRNEIAHELPQLLSDVKRNIDTQSFENIRYLLNKIELWLIKEVDIPTNIDFDGVGVKDEDIRPGSIIMLDAIVGVLA